VPPAMITKASGRRRASRAQALVDVEPDGARREQIEGDRYVRSERLTESSPSAAAAGTVVIAQARAGHTPDKLLGDRSA